MNIELKSQEVLELFDKYKEKLGIGDYELNFGYDFEKEVFLKVNVKGNFTRLNYDTCNSLILELVSSENKEPYVRLSGEYGKLNMGFTSTKQLKLLTDLIDELLKINIHELPEYIDFMKIKQEEKELENKKKELEKQLEEQKKEIDKKLEDIKKEVNE